jgi:hypothetical protein
MQTPEQRRAERTAALSDLLAACAIRCPESAAMTTARLLESSLRHRPADDAHKHARAMSLIGSALAQVQAGATTLDIDVKPRQPTVDALRRDLENTLPRGPS